MRKLILALLLLSLISGCGQAPIARVIADGNGRLNQLTKTTLTATQIEAYRTLSYQLYEQLANEKENVFISPASILFALSMTLQGASGDTLVQMKEALSLEAMSDDEVRQYAYAIQAHLLSYVKTQLNVNNSLWMNEGFDQSVLPEFLNANKEFFGAYVASLDFGDANASNTINAWVKKTTSGLIDKIVPDEIPGTTVMYLINTLYFKADWATPFDKGKNEERLFEEKLVTMMKQESSYPYVSTDRYQAIWLDYVGNETAMIVVLPANGVSLTTQDIQEASEALANAPLTRVRLRMPKVDVSYENKLNEALASLNMVDAFNEATADFSKMSSDAKQLGLHISSVVHKTVLKVDEKGTEAAAATSVEMGVTSMPIDDFVEMTIDRSYVTLLIDANHLLPIFMGRIIDPQP